MNNLHAKFKALFLTLILFVATPFSLYGQKQQLQARKFDEFTIGIGNDQPSRFRDHKQEEKELALHFADYAKQLRLEKASPFVIAYGSRIVAWEIYNRSIAEMRLGSAVERLTSFGFTPEQIRTVDGGFREVATTELWVVPPGAQIPQPGATVSPNQVAYCPSIRLIVPPFVSRSGSPIVFTVEVQTNNFLSVRPTFNWRVSEGEIVSGLGTNTIAVKPMPPGGSGQITAKVDVGGFPLECPVETTTKFVTTTYGSDHYKFDEYGKINCESLAARSDALAAFLMTDPALQVFIIVYDGRRSYRDGALRQGLVIRNYLVDVRGIDDERVTVVEGGYRKSPATELWLSLKGGKAPTATPTVDKKYVELKNQKTKLDPQKFKTNCTESF